MKAKLRLGSSILSLVAMPVLFTLPAWGAATPAIVSTVINASVTQITITGSNFEPASKAPAVALNSASLVLVSFTNQTVVAKLPSGLAAGDYLLTLTNSSSLSITFTVAIGAPRC